MAASDLAQLADVKAWLAGSSGLGSTDDVLLGRLITDMSGGIYAYLSRPWLIPRQVTERYDGSGKRRLYLRRFPVVSIASLLINDVAIPAAPLPAAGAAFPQSGYLLEPWDGTPPGGIQAVDLYGPYSFGLPPVAFLGGRQNVAVTYTAGYQVTGEQATTASYTPLAPFGPWASDQGVAYANGTALTLVKTTPTVGQYQVTLTQSPDAVPPVWSVAYTFDAADVTTGIFVSYGYIPAVINNACIEWVAERYRYRTRIGQSAQTVQGQQTATYSLSGRRAQGMPDFIALSLDPFRAVTNF